MLIRHLWQLKTVVFLHWCLICAVLLETLIMTKWAIVWMPHLEKQLGLVGIYYSRRIRRHDIQHNDTQHNDIQIMTLSITTFIIIDWMVTLSIMTLSISINCNYAECRHAECNYAECRGPYQLVDGSTITGTSFCVF